MASSLVTSINYQERSIVVRPDAFIGSVDDARLTCAGASFDCWAISKPRDGEPMSPPALILVVINNTVIFAAPPNKRRSDLVIKFGEEIARCGLSLQLGIELIPSPLQLNFTFYAYDGRSTASPIEYFKENNRLKDIQIATGSDFIRLIQSPSTRLSDPQILAYTALHCMQRLPPNFAIKAAALCVIGYRLLTKEVEDAELLLHFDEGVASLLIEEPTIERGLFLRWHTSVRLIAGYLAFQRHRNDEAFLHFSAIPPFVKDLVEWPQAMTNILLGLFLTGYFNYKAGRLEEAVEEWDRAPAIFRFGCSIAEFQNYYAYGEVGNALRVVQECYVAVMVIKGGGPINNPNLAPANRDLDLRNLPSPFAKLVSEIHQ